MWASAPVAWEKHRNNTLENKSLNKKLRQINVIENSENTNKPIIQSVKKSKEVKEYQHHKYKPIYISN